jgi:glycerophosphoryl diester phosphodiesterase
MTRIIGHRGARNEAPENTIPSFILAQNNGCVAFELDVRLSRDFQLMVFHDKTLGRTTEHLGCLSDFDALELNRMDARGKHLCPYPCPIPSLEQVFDAVPKTIDWQLEVKPSSLFKMQLLARMLDQFIAHHKRSDVRITVTSSSEWFLKEIKRINPNRNTGLVAEYLGEQSVYKCQALNCDLLVLNHKLCTQKTLQLAKGAGLEVSVWTVNDLTRMKELSSMGVDSIITDIPTQALSQLN